MMDWTGLAFHPIAEAFPLMSEGEISDLADAIEADGFFGDEPIVLYEGKILDGRHRFLACLALHQEGRLSEPPPFREWEQNGVSPMSWAVGKNLRRRHLTPSQKAMIAADLLPRYEEEARARQVAPLKKGDELPVPVSPKLDERGRADAKAAEQFGVSRGYVADAKKIATAAPELVEPIKNGAITLQKAKSELKKRERPAPAPPPTLPTGRFDVLYADPPWRYDFSRVDDWAVENTYPTLTVEQICELANDIDELATDDAVLFLWTTSPKLPQAFEVLAAWGFEYKTSLVWIKHRTGAGMGYWVRVDHELLLIATRGNVPPPPVERRFSSVVEAPKGKHSEKPGEVRVLIERMIPDARRVELFGRAAAEGWSVWGNEAR